MAFLSAQPLSEAVAQAAPHTFTLIKPAHTSPQPGLQKTLAVSATS
jgi:hypothetical protein